MTRQTDIPTITDRASFLAWRTDWRARYAEASTKVRETKRELVRLRAAWRRNEPNHSGRSYEYLINSRIEDLPWVRRQAAGLMIEHRAVIAHRDAIIAATKAEPTIAAIAA
jgi:hypothetical protein